MNEHKFQNNEQYIPRDVKSGPAFEGGEHFRHREYSGWWLVAVALIIAGAALWGMQL